MSGDATAGDFAAFREAVFDDAVLLRALLPPQDRDAYVAQVVAAGAARGYDFDAAAVLTALHEGQDRWLMMGADVV